MVNVHYLGLVINLTANLFMECIIQARMSSKRFPGKILKKIRGKEILTHVISNIKKSKEISKIIVATSTKKNDNLIEKYCIRNKILYYRGPLNNVTKKSDSLCIKKKKF